MRTRQAITRSWHTLYAIAARICHDRDVYTPKATHKRQIFDVRVFCTLALKTSEKDISEPSKLTDERCEKDFGAFFTKPYIRSYIIDLQYDWPSYISASHRLLVQKDSFLIPKGFVLPPKRTCVITQLRWFHESKMVAFAQKGVLLHLPAAIIAHRNMQ